MAFSLNTLSSQTFYMLQCSSPEYILTVFSCRWYYWTQYWRNYIQKVWHFLIEGYFSKRDLLWSGTTQNFQKYLVALHILGTAHTLHCLVEYFLPSPPATVLSSLCLLKSPKRKPGCPFRPSWCSSLLWPLQCIRPRLCWTLDFWYAGPS
jgi:hypothetical protein